VQLQHAQRALAQNVSTSRNGPRPETTPTGPRLRILLRDRDETRDASVRDQNETETLRILSETRLRRDVSMFRDRLETKTSWPRPHPCFREWHLFQFGWLFDINS